MHHPGHRIRSFKDFAPPYFVHNCHRNHSGGVSEAANALPLSNELAL
jgi:hypothetical protein